MTKVKIYDVRSRAEFDCGHAIEAEHFPITKLQQGLMPDINKGTTVLTYCNAGGRAGEAARLLREAGFINAESLGGLEQSGLKITGKYYTED